MTRRKIPSPPRLASPSPMGLSTAWLQQPAEEGASTSSCLTMGDFDKISSLIADLPSKKEVNVLSKLVAELSSKQDIIIMNQKIIMDSIMPERKHLLRPEGLPSLPLKSIADLREFETFLKEGANMSAFVSSPLISAS